MSTAKDTRRLPADQSLGNRHRKIAAALRRATRRAEEASQQAEILLDEFRSAHASIQARFGRDIPPNALLLDVLEQVEVQPGDRWIWLGLRNNRELPTLRVERMERSAVRFLALAFGVITDEDSGMLYPTNGDTEDINPWHRELRRTPTPVGVSWDVRLGADR